METAKAPACLGALVRTTVLVTVFNDARVQRAVESVLSGDRAPDQVLLADGGSTDGTWEVCRALAADPRLVARQWPGSVAETRAAALDVVTGDVTVFLDADETAPAHWLADLVAPVEAGEADVVGGPTRPAAPPRSRAEAFVNDHDAWFYDSVVAHDPATLPMGNSAWRTDLLRQIGGFDPRLQWGGEDYDVNLRARAAGARFQYAPSAWTWHDQSHLDSLRKLWRRQRRYAKGATMAYLKNGALGERLRGAAARSRFHHPYMSILALAKAAGYLDGRRAWRRVRREAA